MADKMYREYFDIDPKYYAAVTAELVAQGKVSWKGFYPHETFVKLLETTYKVMSGAVSKSIWVEGAYGTGKSHAALTIKSMLDASDEEVMTYFNDFGLSKDLRDKWITLKNSGKILTVHRIGSAGINTDLDLILKVQQSIMAALQAHGLENKGEASMRDAFLKWIALPANSTWFDLKIQEPQNALYFGGLDSKSVAERLRTGNQAQVEAMMQLVMPVLHNGGMTSIISDVNDMSAWIKSIIEENDLHAILFVWDEFSEYFLTHPVGLTGFQTLAEISESEPFYFMIVAHESRNLFADADTAKKTLDRFASPVRIDLPDNIGFQLMHQAMKTTTDPVLGPQWEADKADLNDSLTSIRTQILTLVRKQAKLGVKAQLSDKEMQDIVPMHPYASLLLKYIATIFKSNTRSMFEFIIDTIDKHGFRWYIDEYGPDSDQNLLTVDLLWDYFYEDGQAELNDDVRGILDSYRMLQSDKLLPDEQRVLKTVLLLQALAMRVSDELLVPNDQNLELAFAGTDWTKGKSLAIAKGLIDKNLLFIKPVAGGKSEYCVAGGGGDNIGEYRDKAISQTTTQGLIVNGGLLGAVQLPAAIAQRFNLTGTGYSNLPKSITNAKDSVKAERYAVVVTFAMNDTEAKQNQQKILQAVNQPQNETLFIEVLTPMGKDLYDQYIDALAFSLYHAGSDKEQARHYQDQATNVLGEWLSNISAGAFMLYGPDAKGGLRQANLAALQETLRGMDVAKYYWGLDAFTLNATMYSCYQLANGAMYGINEETSGAYKNSNKKMSLENALDGVWGVKRYWEDPTKASLPVVHIKQKVDEIIHHGFESGSGRVSILTIWNELEKEPYGFMPSSVAAFVLGFVLKEYATPDFFCSNGTTSDPMSVDKMKVMIANAIMPPPKGYREEYIVTMSPELRTFLNGTSRVFRIPTAQCGSVESTRDQIRIKMKGLSFPIWCIKYVLKDEALASTPELVTSLLEDYTGIANTANSNAASENVLAERIGKTIMENPTVIEDLERLLCSEKCRQGMLAYIGDYQGGALIELAQSINDGGSYLDEVKKKFSAGDANWVWNRSTVDEKISDVILEYQIILESNKSLGKYNSLRDVVSAWNARTNNIKIPCEAVAKLTGDLGTFLWQLHTMKQNSALLEQNKRKFYDLLVTQREPFDAFYKDQVPYFKQDASAFLGDLDDDDIAQLYASLPAGQFTKGKSEYYKLVETKVKEFIQGQWKKKLRDLWEAKTQTKGPDKWSDEHETPILCMFDDASRTTAKAMFQIIMSSNPGQADAKKAIEWLESSTFFDSLKDEEKIDRCFMERIVGEKAILLKVPKEIRQHLLRTVHDSVYYWMDNSSVQNALKVLVDKEYKLTGCDRAMAKIAEMDTESLRRYLRDRIADDPDFGMQILKG